jgi:hypothetical protein
MKHSDPWAIVEPGWERYTGPAAEDGFTPLDSRAGDLADYLRAEIKGQSPRPRQTVETVVLPDGTHAQLIEKAADNHEIVVHLQRDQYRVFSSRTRAGVLEAANEFYS